MTTVEPTLADLLRDRYTLLGELGRGSMATCISPRISSTAEWRSRVLRQDLAASLGGARFLREIELAANLTSIRRWAFHSPTSS